MYCDILASARLNAFWAAVRQARANSSSLTSGRLPGRALQPPEAALSPSRPHDSKQRPQRHGASRRSGGPRHGSRRDDARRRQPHDGRIGVPRARNEAARPRAPRRERKTQETTAAGLRLPEDRRDRGPVGGQVECLRSHFRRAIAARDWGGDASADRAEAVQ